jgi:hypothetical protein
MSHWTQQLPEVGAWADRFAMDSVIIAERIAKAEAEIARLHAAMQELELEAINTARRHYSSDEISVAIEATIELINH